MAGPGANRRPGARSDRRSPYGPTTGSRHDEEPILAFLTSIMTSRGNGLRK